MQRIVICDPVNATREALRGHLLGLDFAFLDAECKRYDAFYDIICDGAPPELAIVHLDGSPEKAAQLVAQMNSHFPGVSLLVISKNHAAILESLQAGAKHFLTEPYAFDDLLKVLRKAMNEAGAIATAGSGPVPRMTTSSQIVAVLGSRGGIGSTSLAVNLGCSFASDSENTVALIDLDLAMGDAGVHLALSPNYTLADLSANIDKLDLNFLKRSLVRHDVSGLSVLDRPVQISDLDVIQGAHVERVLNLLRLSQTHLIVNLSKRFTSVDASALAVSDHILLVTQLELTSVLNATRIMAALVGIDEIDSKLKVVLNKAGAEELDDDRHRISAKKAEEIIGKPFFWTVPFEPKPMGGARNEGVPLGKYAPRSRVHQAIQGLAVALSNKPQAQTAPAAGGGFLRGLFKK